MTFISKAEFLAEHNRLSPQELQTTLAMLTHFQEEKKPLLKDNAWSIDKLRIPVITWLLAQPKIEEKKGALKAKSDYRIYPGTK